MQCVIEGLTLPHKGHHHKKNDLLGDRSTAHGSKHQHKPCARHHSPAHVVATGAQRETVPTPLQDFVLLSGSPLFHERPRASDIKANITDATAVGATDQKAPQGTQEKEAAVNQTITKLQGPEPLSNQQGEAIQQHQESVGTTDLLKTEQKQVNGTEQHPMSESEESSKAQLALSQELPQKMKEGLNQGKDQEKLTNGTISKAPGVAITVKTPARPTSPSGVTIGLGNNSLANGDQENPTEENAPNKIVTIAVNGQNVGTNYKATSPNENQTDISVASNIKPESENQNIDVGHFPFNIPGIRNYGNGKNDSKVAEASKLITDKQTKLGLHENLGPNCHWKTTKGANGAVITSVACSGEFHKPEADNKGGLGEVGQKPGQAERFGSKQTSAKLLTSPMKAEGGEKEMQLQSDKEFEDDAVTTTNAFRKIHRALPMKLSPELSLQAKKYAEKIASMGSLQHDYVAVKHLDEGENLAMGCKQYGVPLTAKEAITNWYNEVCAYDFNRGEFSMSTGHFTQLVWSDSTEFGIGMAPGQQNGMPCVFVVGRFKPSGNYKGEYKKNVFKGTFDPSYCDKLRDKKLL